MAERDDFVQKVNSEIETLEQSRIEIVTEVLNSASGMEAIKKLSDVSSFINALKDCLEHVESGGGKFDGQVTPRRGIVILPSKDKPRGGE